ncbi:YhgE/Pip domain-containing protein [Clostridium manihotivorum]|uniref:YhgE/Pip domain-containing protein n=1 Tax=Clostridium manihotivorum TaxID=2320868 RepID=A0A3R5TEL3_9CLOT|nr:YhgE/Pip domain-containing protein [Clostridium manihotivorum]QAA31580.1 YhgE/Pip domain-containing protein [Clostridium manihotivorum]
MKNILKVFKRDMKSIAKNPVALLIIGGLCVIPSLYAWVNIKACWDPYENTSTIPVAVVNNDRHVSFRGKEINIGEQVVEKLKDNKKIGWTFVNSKDADLGVVDGTYYAAVEIPEDFSSRFVSVLSDNPKKPQINYKVDTKANPVATKITGVAKNTLTEEITSNFVETVNSTIFTSLNDVGQNAEKNKQDIIKLKDNIILMNKNMDSIIDGLKNIHTRSGDLSKFLTEIKATMPSISSGLNVVIQSNDNNKQLIKSTQTAMNNSFDNIGLTLNSSQASVYRIQALVSELNTSASSTATSQMNSTVGQISMEITNLNNGINSTIDFLQKLNETNPNGEITKMITSLKNIQNALNDESKRLDNLKSQLNDANKINKDMIDSINNGVSNLNVQIINTTKLYNTSTRASLNTIANNLIVATDDATDLLKSAQDLGTQIDKLMNTAIDGTNLANKVSGDLDYRLLQFKDVIGKLSDKLQLINNNDLVEIITILQSNPTFMGDFISDPINLKDEAINAIPNYGSAMAPIYTVLALWVGCLLLTSLLKTKVAPFEGSERITLREKHFGKMLTFITLAAIQGFIVTVGDKLLLNVYTVNAALMIIFGVVSSIVFAIITYTLVSILGNIGKAVAIVFMIIQLAGSGGTYPIQVDPMIFRILQPLFPFTYSVGGFREAIAGPLISSVVLDFTVLLIIAAIFILIGFFLKEPLHNPIHRFEERFEESGIGE